MSNYFNIQSILFDLKYWNENSARIWLRDHNYKYNGKVDFTTNKIRFRQFNPDSIRYRYKTFPIDKHESIEFILQYPA